MLTIIFLLGTFFLISYVRTVKEKVLSKYPKDVNCDLDQFKDVNSKDVVIEYSARNKQGDI